MKYKGLLVGTEITIKDENLIKPAELKEHIGEILVFHNRCGCVVSGKLSEFEYTPDEYSFNAPGDTIRYEDEIDTTVESVRWLVCEGMHHSQQLYDITYIAVPTEEELAFRDKLVSLDQKWFDDNDKYINALTDKYEKTEVPDYEKEYDWQLNLGDELNDEERMHIDKIFNL